MSVIKLKVVVSNLETVLATFTHIKIYRSTTGLAGIYTELSIAATRPVLEAGKIIYDFTDDAGDADYYYKSSYYNNLSGLESSLSEAQQGEGDTAIDVISVDELKTNYLFGIDLTDDTGEAYPDSLYEWFIKAAVSWLEHKLDIAIRPIEITDEKHDYYREDFNKYMFFALNVTPVIDVSEVKLVLPGEQTSQIYDRDWIHLRKDSGQVQIVPNTGSLDTIILTSSGNWLSLLYSGRRFLPDLIRATYTAGFETGQIPYDIKHIVGMASSFGPLNIAGDLLGGAGIASQAISIDGLSQSFNTTSSATNAGYGARIVQYNREIKTGLDALRKKYKPLQFGVI